MKKRILSILLSLCMVCMLLPTAAFAEEAQPEESLPGEQLEQVQPVPDEPVAPQADDVDVSKHTNHTSWTKIETVPGGKVLKGNEEWTTNDGGYYVLDSGNYYLGTQISLGNSIQIPRGATVTLCLNGKTITGGSDKAAIIVATGATLNLTECNERTIGQITHKTGQKGRGVEVKGTFHMYGGSITGNSTTTDYNATSKGGGVYVNGSSAAFNMCGGSITGNTAAQDGGGVYVENGKFKMTAGTIGGTATENANTAKNGGGVYVVDSNPGTVPTCTFDMTGGSITGNKATENGGGVFAGRKGTFTMTGGTIGGTATGDANTAKYGGGVAVVGTFDMTGGSITGNKATENGGGVYVSNEGGSIIAYGKFTMAGGTISGNMTASGGSGGGVFVNYGGTFTMTGGEITGNTASGYGDGGGVFVNEGGTFQMSDDSCITGNTGYRGGGVSVDRNYGTTYNPGAFTMSSGNITDNNAEYGGGVYISGNFTMSGGIISSNRATGNSGGVHMNTDSTFTVSGAPKITGNTLKSGTTNNVRLSEGTTTGTSPKPDATITIGDAHLSTGASIGVTTEKTLTTGSSVTIATGAVGDVDYTKIFKSDAASQGYVVIKDGNNLKLSTHRHSWSYTANGGATITATCGNDGCTSPTYSETLTISASDATYDGTAKAAALSANKALISGLKDISATYEKYVDDTWTNFDGTPTDAGKYKASIKVGTGESAVTASVEYTIAKADGSLTAPTAKTGLVYNGSDQALVTAGSGTGGTIKYSLDNRTWSETIPTGKDAKPYTVYYKLVGDANHNDAAGGSVDVTIDKADPTVTVPTAKTLTYTGSAQELINAGSTTGGTMEYRVGSSGDWTNTIPTGTNAGTYNVYYKVVGDSNHNDTAEDVYVTVTISQATLAGNDAAKYIRYNDTAEKTFTAADFSLDLAGTITLNGDVTASRSVLDTAYPKFEGGAIKVKLKDSLSFVANTTVTIPVTFTPSDTNYARKDYTLTITLTSKDPQAALTLNPSDTTVAYGQTLTLGTTGGTTGSTVTYAVTSGPGTASITDNVLTATGVGTVTVTATMAGNDAYSDVTSAPVTITINPKQITPPAADTTVFTYNGAAQTYGISATGDYTVTGNEQTNANESGYTVTVTLTDKVNTVWDDTQNTTNKEYSFVIRKATPTGAPAYTPITASGKTLADAALTVGTITPAGGTIVWDQGDSTAVSANTAYNWTYTPAVGDQTNYNTLTGSITPYVVSYSGGGSYTPPTYKVESEVTESTDGNVSFSKDSAKKDDTVTITVTPDRYYKVDGVTVKDKNGKEIAVTDNGDGTFTFKMPASKVTVEPVFSWDNPFVDVAETAYYAPAVEWALKNDITNGTGDGTTFSPNAGCTRAQIVTFLWKAAGCPEPVSTNSFTDVSADAYYAKAVAWAVEQGITNGTGGGKFSPDAICTRSQSMTFLYHVAGSPEVTDGIAFSDVAADSYYADAVVWAAQNGVTSGTGNGKFSPGADCTRAQIMTFLYRWLVK